MGAFEMSKFTGQLGLPPLVQCLDNPGFCYSPVGALDPHYWASYGGPGDGGPVIHGEPPIHGGGGSGNSSTPPIGQPVTPPAPGVADLNQVFSIWEQPVSTETALLIGGGVLAVIVVLSIFKKG
jgi:hypothetical protein